MYEFAHAAPETHTTPARMALTAERAGYDALVLRNHTGADEYPEFDVPDDAPVPVHEGVEVRAEGVESLHEGVRRAEVEGTDLIAVHGGDSSINSAAVEHDGVDLLAHPNRNRGSGRSFNHVLAREAAENGVAVEFSFAHVLRKSGGERVKVLRDIHETLGLIHKYGTPFIITADPYTHLHLRAPRELRALARLVGFGDDEFERATCETPESLLADDDEPVEVVG